ncbi:ATP-binding protein [Halomonas korlensis]|uniref:Thymidylate kinase n=1 Tax=Halomonas korlensis TaxID=463301 RepID=A0A1I7F885_9GAMM|nr:ATP-binding protein [Halomonas korlensis]SFU32374.1 Thymidylate kinase [Halomonas korlensis]
MISIHKKVGRRDPIPCFVEFVGPRSSGKTTLLNCLKNRYGHEFSYVGAPDLSWFAKARIRLRQELFGRRMFNGHQLDAFSSGRLIKGFSKVTGGLDWYANCRGEIFVVDEGPFRVIMDYAAHSEIQYQVWRKFCINKLEILSRYRVLVVFVKADPAVHFERDKKRRVEESQRGSLQGYSSGYRESFRNRRFFREEAISLLEARKYNNFQMVTLVNDNDVGEVAFRVRNLIHNNVAWKSD